MSLVAEITSTDGSILRVQREASSPHEPSLVKLSIWVLPCSEHPEGCERNLLQLPPEIVVDRAELQDAMRMVLS